MLFLKKLRKSSPKLARLVKDGGKSVLNACSKNGMTTQAALQTIGDFLQQSIEKAEEGDKQVIEVMKEELKSEKTTEEIKNKLEAMFAVIVDDAIGGAEEEGGEEEPAQAAESSRKITSVNWIVLN